MTIVFRNNANGTDLDILSSQSSSVDRLTPNWSMPDHQDSLTRIHPLGFTNLVEVKKLYPLPGTSPTLPRDRLTEQPESFSATDRGKGPRHKICVNRVPRRAVSRRRGVWTHFTSNVLTELNCSGLHMSTHIKMDQGGGPRKWISAEGVG